MTASPRWLPDPTGRHEHRYWDGESWTDDVSDAGVTAQDPMSGDDPASPPTVARDAPEETAVASPPQSPPLSALRSRRRRGRPGRSNRVLVGLGVVFGALMAGLVLIVLGQDDDDSGRDADEEVSVIAEAVQASSNGAVTDEEADCVVEAMSNELGTERLDEVAEATLTNPDPLSILEDDELSAVFRSMLECVPPDRLAEIMATAGADATGTGDSGG